MLRPYQQKIIQALRNSILKGNKRIALCAPTGAGKTRMFCAMVDAHIKKGGKALIITDRIELVKQAGKSFENIEEIKAGKEPDLSKNLHCAMLETLYRRMDKEYYQKYLSTRTMVILDEAHKASFDKLFCFFSENTIVIGATATPLRIGKQPAMDNYYTDMVQDVDTPDLISQGFLSNALTYGVDIDLKGVKMQGGDYEVNSMAQRYHEQKVYEGVISNYKRICPNTKAILFASNIDSSKEICEQLLLAGIPSRHLDSENYTHQERSETLQWFKETPNAVLCNCSLFTTGFDEPTIETVILYRATKSLPLFLQMVGRGSRTIPGLKDKFYILDFGCNIKTHNFWQAPRTWSLTKKQRKKKEGPAPVKICPSCRAMLAVSVMQCTYCKFEFKKEYGGKNEFAELKLLSPPEIWKVAEAADIAKKARMAKEKLIKPMTVLHKLKTKEEGLEFIRQMGYKPSFAYINRHRFKCFESL